MQKQAESSCTRCGKTRVVAKVWKEYIGKSLVTYTDTVCPDPACQKIVEEEIAARREKRELFINKRSLSSLHSDKRSLFALSSNKRIKQTKPKTNSSKAKRLG